jgi:hypothetical protein
MKPISRLRMPARAASPAPLMAVPLISTLPLLGTSSSPIRLRSVLLPQPEGPMIEMNSPFSTSRVTSARATVSMRSVR